MRRTGVYPPTGLIPWFSKTEGNTYATLLHHPFFFKVKPMQCYRGRRRISGAVAGESTQKSIYQVPITIPISRITLFAICLSFSSPPNSPLPFYSPSLSLSSLSFSICLFLPAWFLFACVLDCLPLLSLWIVLPLLLVLPRARFLILNKGEEQI